MKKGPLVLGVMAAVVFCGWFWVDEAGWSGQLTIISGTLPAEGLQPARLGLTLLMWALTSIVAPVLFLAALLWTGWNWAVPLGPDTTRG